MDNNNISDEEIRERIISAFIRIYNGSVSFGSEHLHARCDELLDAIHSTILFHLNPERYEDEHLCHLLYTSREFNERCGRSRILPRPKYPACYQGPKPIDWQVKELARIFEVDPANALRFASDLPALPEGAEGWFAVLQDKQNSLSDMLKKIASRRLGEFLPPDGCGYYYETEPRTSLALEQLNESQPGAIKIIPAQLGLSHHGLSLRLSRDSYVGIAVAHRRLVCGEEFGLTSKMCASILLLHPERVAADRSLGLVAAGDRFHNGDERGDDIYCLENFYTKTLVFRQYDHDYIGGEFRSYCFGRNPAVLRTDFCDLDEPLIGIGAATGFVA